MFSVHGSSGSNWVVLRALALSGRTRSCSSRVDPPLGHQRAEGLRARLPVPADAVRAALRGAAATERRAGPRGPAPCPEAVAVFYTSPTYEGLTADTRGIVECVHAVSPTAMVVVDEAWGGHLHFHPDLPESAMAAGADVCVQSTHKLAGGLQQTGLLHWHEGRVDTELMEEAYREYVTTSPSYHLLASADAAVRTLAAQGEEALSRAIERTDALKAGLRGALPDLDWMDDAAGCARSAPTPGVGPREDDNRPVALPAVGVRGCACARRARDRDQKAGVQTITLIATFQLGRHRRAGHGRRRSSACSAIRCPRAVLREGPDREPVLGHRRRPCDAPVLGRAGTRSRSATSCRCARRSGRSRPRSSRSIRPGSR